MMDALRILCASLSFPVAGRIVDKYITIAAIITGRTVSVKTFLKEKFLEACAKRLIFYTKCMTT
jgi:hypothetical protein